MDDAARKAIRENLRESTSDFEYEFDYQPVSDPSTLENVDFQKAEVVSLYGCQISELALFDKFLKMCPNLKVLWVNENPICKDKDQEEIMRRYVEQDHPHIELFNSKFTRHCSDWGLRFVSLAFDLNLTRNTPNALIRRLDLSGRNLYRIDHFIEKLKDFPNVNQVAARETFFDSYEQANRFLDMMKSLPQLRSLELDYYMLDLFWKIRDRILILYPHFRDINGYHIGFTQPGEVDLKLDRIVENTWRTCNWFSFQVPETDVTIYSLDPKTLAKRGASFFRVTLSVIHSLSHRLLFERRAGQLHF